MKTVLTPVPVKAKKINTPFGYFGSKNRIAAKLCADLPPHTCWVEAFCGSAALTLRKAPAPIEVINDIDSEIYNVFRQLRKHPDLLIEAVRMTPYAEQELAEARRPKEGLSELERARRFLVQSMMAINGIFGKERSGFSYTDSFSRNGQDARVCRWNNLPERLEPVIQRLKNVRIENKDALRIMKRYLDRPNTLMYLDPPYLGERTSGYDNDVNDVEYHTKMLKLANQANCMIFISTYEHPLYDELLSGWHKRTIATSTRGTNGITRARTEVIWMNRNYIEALEASRIPLALTEKEKMQGRFNPETHQRPTGAGTQLTLTPQFLKYPAMGKYELYRSRADKKFYFRLKAGNGRVILSSQGYASKNDCRNGIAFVRAYSPTDHHYHRKDDKKFSFVLQAVNGQLIGDGASYTSPAAREKGVELVKINASGAPVEDLT